MCGQRKKHNEHFEEKKKRKREPKEVTREIEKVNMEKKPRGVPVQEYFGFCFCRNAAFAQSMSRKIYPQNAGRKISTSKKYYNASDSLQQQDSLSHRGRKEYVFGIT